MIYVSLLKINYHSKNDKKIIIKNFKTDFYLISTYFIKNINKLNFLVV